MRLPKQKIRTNLMIRAGFSKAGVNGPGNIHHFTSTRRERRDSFLFCVILPKIWILWTPGEQKLLFGGTIILGECSAVVRDRRERHSKPRAQGPCKVGKEAGQRSRAETFPRLSPVQARAACGTRRARWPWEVFSQGRACTSPELKCEGKLH